MGYNRERFLEVLQSLGRSDNTISAYDSDMKSFFSFYHDLTFENIQNYVYATNKSASSLNRFLCSVRFYCRVEKIELDLLILNLPKVVKQEQHFITEHVFDEGIKKIRVYKFRGYDNKFVENCFQLLYKTGLRINEFLELTREEFADSDSVLRIIGKGEKFRVVPVISELCPALVENSFYVSKNKLPYSTILSWSKKFFGQQFSPHSFRHGYTTRLIDQGVELPIVQKLLGHEHYDTTLGYNHPNMKNIMIGVERTFGKGEG